MYRTSLTVAAVAGLLSISVAGIVPVSLDATTSTFEVWKFNALGEVLVLIPTNDVSGDSTEELAVAVEQFAFLVDGATGKGIWTYKLDSPLTWIGAHAADVNNDGNHDVLLAADNRFVMLLDGATGEQIWNSTIVSSLYELGDVCFPSARSLHPVSDIDGDEILDVVLVSGTGDQCPKDDQFSVSALSTKSGQKLWEYLRDEDYHGLKEGVRASSPAVVLDINGDGNKEIAITDDRNILYLIDGLSGDLIETEELDISGAIWNLMVVPDVSGDGIEDVIGLEFIDGVGGPDYASMDAIDIASAKVLWQVKAGDGFYEGGAFFSMTWVASGSSARPSIHVAATQRIENELDLILLEGVNGEEIWRFNLGEDRSREDMAKHYPVATVPDLNSDGRDEIAIRPVGTVIHLLDSDDARIVWSHSVEGAGSVITSIPTDDGQRYILVGDNQSRVSALAGLTMIETDITIEASEEVIILSRKVTISGTISPSLPGEVVQLRYVDPTGFVISKPLVVARDGSYIDEIQPKVIGNWKASVSFAGEGFYSSAQSPTISFAVENETRNSVYSVEIESDDNTSVSYSVVYLMEGGQVDQMSIDEQQKSLNIAINPFEGGGTLRIELSRSMIDALDSSYKVLVDNEEVEFDEIDTDMQTRTLLIPFSSNSEQIRIIGTYIVPEFPVATIMLTVAIVGMIAVMAIRNRLFYKI